jgi:nuclear RNA export factor
MLQKSSTPPIGPRSSRLGPHRGGIQKRSRDSSRADKDSEMDIDTIGGSIGKGRRDTRRERTSLKIRGVTGSGRDDKTFGPTRTSLSAAAVQKAIIRGLGSEDAMARGLRQGPRFARQLGKHLGRDRDSPAKGLAQLIVRGFKDSKAASNPDGGIKDLLAFLERKASADTSARETVKIKKVCLTLCSSGLLRHRNSASLVRSRFKPSSQNDDHRDFRALPVSVHG